MNRIEFIMVREQVLEVVDSICDGELEGIISDRLRDELVRRLADMVCEVMDPVGLE